MFKNVFWIQKKKKKRIEWKRGGWRLSEGRGCNTHPKGFFDLPQNRSALDWVGFQRPSAVKFWRLWVGRFTEFEFYVKKTEIVVKAASKIGSTAKTLWKLALNGSKLHPNQWIGPQGYVFRPKEGLNWIPDRQIHLLKLKLGPSKCKSCAFGPL